jgi:hypothetical protein
MIDAFDDLYTAMRVPQVLQVEPVDCMLGKKSFMV